ncbi:MAG: hypothetical protein M1817_003167 [Caeruleum heppii]|nr:MAG: hypothetical protein M1817_003167 [Caeruleum heppii]
MALTTLLGRTNAVKHFQIRLDSDILVFHGDDIEATGQLLRGTLVLCLSEPLNVKAIKLRFFGFCRIAWFEGGYTRFTQWLNILEETVFFNHEWSFLDQRLRRDKTLPAGNYEWPFELLLPSDTSESIEGLEDNYIVWRLKATIERGALAQNLHVSKHVRIVRTLSPSTLELAHQMSIANVWVDKVDYHISIPSKAVIFGTSVPVELRFFPLAKGLAIGKIYLNLVENLTYTLSNKQTKWQRDVAESHFNGGVEMGVVEGRDGWLITHKIPLPKSLRECLQDVDEQGIRIRHKLHFHIELKNADGHSSEEYPQLRAVLPLLIFISPHLMVDASNQVPSGSDINVQTLRDIEMAAPPLYGAHQFDQLWSDVDSSGYRTPAMLLSGVNTPDVRRGSYDTLAPLTPQQEAFPPQALRQRLSNLPHPDASRRPADQHGSNGSDDAQAAATAEERHSDDGGRVQRRTLGVFTRRSSGSSDGDVSQGHVNRGAPSSTDLSQVPSYTTALRNPPRTPVSTDLPGYAAATSAIEAHSAQNISTPARGGSPRHQESSIEDQNLDPVPATTAGTPQISNETSDMMSQDQQGGSPARELSR